MLGLMKNMFSVIYIIYQEYWNQNKEIFTVFDVFETFFTWNKSPKEIFLLLFFLCCSPSISFTHFKLLHKPNVAKLGRSVTWIFLYILYD